LDVCRSPRPGRKLRIIVVVETGRQLDDYRLHPGVERPGVEQVQAEDV
jgi:hypothetical protein